MGDHDQNQQQSVEISKVAAAQAQEKESNLSETAKLVNFMLKEYIMPVLREANLVATANDIIKAKLQPDDAKVIEFSLACREKQSQIHEKTERDGRSSKELAVVSNYFSKLINTVKISASITANPKPEQQSQSVTQAV